MSKDTANRLYKRYTPIESNELIEDKELKELKVKEDYRRKRLQLVRAKNET